MSKPASFLSAEEFADRARMIVETLRGHEAHRAIDLLSNDVLRGLGYGEGVEIFEQAVGHWHDTGLAYPPVGPCPDCEAAADDERAAA